MCAQFLGKHSFLRIWMVLLVSIIMINIENSSADSFSVNEDCVTGNGTENVTCTEKFRKQSMSVFSVVDSSVGIFEDPETKITVVDLGTFYGIGGNGTIPDVIQVYRDDVIWKTTTKETGIAPSTSHSEWQIPQTFFFNELPGRYTLVLITNNTKTLVYEFLVKQIANESEKNNFVKNMIDTPKDEMNTIIPKLAPLKQIASGIPRDEILCKENLQLVFKNTNGSPACVMFETVEKLIERGWANIRQ